MSIKSFAGIGDGGLLGFFPGQAAPMQSLLGEAYDPRAARMRFLGGALSGIGMGLASGKPGAWAQGAILGAQQGMDNYQQQAFDAYRMKVAQEDRDYRRSRDALADKNDERDYQLRKAEYDSNKAWRGTQRQHQLEQWDREDEQRQGQQDYVTGWMDEQTQAGADLPFSPGVRSIARQGGVTGPSAADQWRFNNASPYAESQDYGNAFTQIAAQPPAFTPAQTRKFRRGDQEVTQEFDPATGGWNDISTGYAFKNTPDTTVQVMPNGEPADSTLRKQLSTKEGDLWNTYKSNADTAGGLVQDLEALDELGKLAPNGPLTGRLAEMFPGFSSAADAYQSIILRAAPNLRVAGSGSTSDIEYEGMLKSFPMLRNTQEGNAVISAVMKRKADITIQRGQIVDQYLNGDLSAVEARRQLTALNRQSILDPAMKRLIQGTSGKAPAEMSDDEILNQLNGGAN